MEHPNVRQSLTDNTSTPTALKINNKLRQISHSLLTLFFIPLNVLLQKPTWLDHRSQRPRAKAYDGQTMKHLDLRLTCWGKKCNSHAPAIIASEGLRKNMKGGGPRTVSPRWPGHNWNGRYIKCNSQNYLLYKFIYYYKQKTTNSLKNKNNKYKT